MSLKKVLNSQRCYNKTEASNPPSSLLCVHILEEQGDQQKCPSGKLKLVDKFV